MPQHDDRRFGADLARASPLQQPADPYEWTSDGSSWTPDGDGTANEASADSFWQAGTATTGDYSWDYSWPEYDLGSIETDRLPTFGGTWSDTIHGWRLGYADVIYCDTTSSVHALFATGGQAAGGWLAVVLPLPDDVGVRHTRLWTSRRPRTTRRRPSPVTSRAKRLRLGTG